MVFSSMLFVFLFLPANLISQLVLKTPKKRNIAMLVFSLIFYSWGGPRYLLLLLGMVLICWVGALLIEHAEPENKKTLMVITVALCLLILGIFKYLTFLLGTAQSLFSVPEVVPKIALPIGISFYTFQLISYVVDVYRGDVHAQKRYWMLLLYASLFHQCIAGPIVRYKDVNDDIRRRKVNLAEISRGISRFSIGLAKKAVLANGCAAVADQLLLSDATELAAIPAMGILLGGFAFMMQLYLDFSAYSDMAIGMGLMCGFHYKENFNHPFVSKSFKEWNSRWHISLGSFFRDYLYYPLGGSRCDKNRQIFNLMVVWMLTGLWHGASWNFVIWGAFEGLMIVLERFVWGKYIERAPGIVGHIYVLLFHMFSMLLFKFTTLPLLGTAIGGLFGLHHNGFTNASVTLLFKNNIWFLIFSFIACLPIGTAIRSMLSNLGRRSNIFEAVNLVWEVVHPVLLLLISAMALAGVSYNPFLYFQF